MPLSSASLFFLCFIRNHTLTFIFGSTVMIPFPSDTQSATMIRCACTTFAPTLASSWASSRSLTTCEAQPWALFPCPCCLRTCAHFFNRLLCSIPLSTCSYNGNIDAERNLVLLGNCDDTFVSAPPSSALVVLLRGGAGLSGTCVCVRCVR